MLAGAFQMFTLELPRLYGRMKKKRCVEMMRVMRKAMEMIDQRSDWFMFIYKGESRVYSREMNGGLGRMGLEGVVVRVCGV